MNCSRHFFEEITMISISIIVTSDFNSIIIMTIIEKGSQKNKIIVVWEKNREDDWRISQKGKKKKATNPNQRHL